MTVNPKDSKTINIALHNLKKLFAKADSQDEILSKMMDPTKLLVDAIREKNISFIQEMANLGGVDFNVRDELGRTPVFWATLLGEDEILTVLLKAGADPNIQDVVGDTALMQAVGEGYIRSVKVLLEVEKAEVNQVNNAGYTALTYACREEVEEAVEILLNHHADVNVQDRSGCTVLVDLILMNQTEAHQKMIQLIVDKMSPNDLMMHKEILSLISVAHATSQRGVSLLRAVNKNLDYLPIELEGAIPHYWIKKMSKATSQFEKLHPELIKKNVSFKLMQMLQHAASDSNEGIILRHEKGMPVLLSVGFKRHTVSVLIWENNFIICNRGRGSRKVTEVFHFEPENLTIEVLEKIQRVQLMKEADYLNLFFRELPDLLKFKDPPLKNAFEKTCVLPMQTSDNCSWASPELAVLVFFMMDRFLTDVRGFIKKVPPLGHPLFNKLCERKKLLESICLNLNL